ncbi:MAG: hypothetical protein AB1656_01140 [Candidatus Omnitrophota bacterium]
MPNIGPDSHALHSDDPILKRTGRKLGQFWTGAEGTLSGGEHRIALYVMIAQRLCVRAVFPGKPQTR